MLGNSRGVQTDRYTFCVREDKKQWDKKRGTKIKSVFFYDNLLDPYQLKKISASEYPDISKKLLTTLGLLLKKNE